MTVNADITLTAIHPNTAEGPARPTVFQKVQPSGASSSTTSASSSPSSTTSPACRQSRLAGWSGGSPPACACCDFWAGQGGRFTLAEAALIEVIPGCKRTDTVTSRENRPALTALDEEIAQMATDLAEGAADGRDDYEHETL